jgi:hypothetical protein
MSQFRGSPLQSQAPDRGGSRLAEMGVVDAMPMIGREARDPGQHIEAEFLVQVIVDVGGDPGEAAGVALCGGLFHRGIRLSRLLIQP